MEAMHYPDVWYEYANWHVDGGGGGSAPALAVLHRGRRVCGRAFEACSAHGLTGSCHPFTAATALDLLTHQYTYLQPEQSDAVRSSS